MDTKQSPQESLAQTLTGTTNEAEARDRFRTQHGVQLVSGDQVGESAQKLPAGLYGFSYTPFGGETPLFTNRPAMSYEVHTLKGGELHAICFADAETAVLIAANKETDYFEVFPEVVDKSDVPVSIPFSQMVGAKPLMRNKRNCLKVRLRGA